MGYVDISIEEGIARISIKRPMRNRLNRVVIRQLRKTFANLVGNQELKGVIITGSGSTFSNGAEMKELANLNYASAKEYSKLGQETFLLLSKIDQPVVAAINGTAFGPGLDLALACDVRIASQNAQFQHPEKKFGITPCFGGSVRLTKVIGREAAQDMICNSRKLDANEAHQIGLVDYLVDKDNIMLEAEHIILNEEVSKGAFRRDDFKEEREAFARCFCDSDVRKKLKKKS